ncbi:hypothetical protein EON73_00225 [bacterium]|nr:MAG: hypothetical protein EON73_00225 [bacterium]
MYANQTRHVKKMLVKLCTRLCKTSRRRRQTFGLQALQSKALYGLQNVVLHEVFGSTSFFNCKCVLYTSTLKNPPERGGYLLPKG